MRGPARPWLTVLAVAAAAQVAAAAERFVPADPGFVVANISQTLPDEPLRELFAHWRAAADDASAIELSHALIERARARREPRYFGRAEAVLAPRARLAGAAPELRLLYAETLQFRHAFAAAERILDQLLRERPHDADARLRRGSLRLTRGDFAGARADCAQLALARSAVALAGFACLAEAMAGSGQLQRGRDLLAAVAVGAASLDPAARAYLLATRAELAERAGELPGAIRDYREASRLAPDDDSIRAALADALVAQGDPGAAVPLQVDNPSLALLVRAAALARDQRAVLMTRASGWLQLEAARGDAIHHREAALLALANREPARALAEAQANFASQRELADVRVLARAAIDAEDAAALDALKQWLRASGYQDAITESILAGRPRG